MSIITKVATGETSHLAVREPVPPPVHSNAPRQPLPQVLNASKSAENTDPIQETVQLSPVDVLTVLSEASVQSRIPEKDTHEPIPVIEPVSPQKTEVKKRRRRKKWCCCCCQKKKSQRELNSGDTQSQYDEYYSDSDSEDSSWTGCLGGMLDSRSVGERTRGGDDRTLDRSTVMPASSFITENIRRTRIPDRPNYSLNLWSLLKNSLGKELSKIPMPVNFSEPLSMLQRLTEDYEYSDVLDKAAKCDDSCEQMAYVAAFTVSSYATTSVRTAKPFNPLLGETYEWDRTVDFGWRCISEQVSHHPPTAALYCEGKGWKCWQEFTMTSKFKGNSLEIIPLGIAHLTFEASGNHYTWRKVTTVVRNIVVGKLWVDQTGEMVINNHKNGDKCTLNYIPYSVFNKKQKEVTGTVKSSDGTVKWTINGSWDVKIEGAQVKSMDDKAKSDVKPSEKSFVMGVPKLLWARRFPPPESEKYYNFTQFAVQMNEMEPGIPPTDSRMRPDQRLMEDGKWDEANAEKVRLEEKQRSARKKRADDTKKSQQTLEGDNYVPAWFRKEKDLVVEGTSIYTYKGEYWPCKDQKNWSRCSDIF